MYDSTDGKQMKVTDTILNLIIFGEKNVGARDEFQFFFKMAVMKI